MNGPWIRRGLLVRTRPCRLETWRFWRTPTLQMHARWSCVKVSHYFDTAWKEKRAASNQSWHGRCVAGEPENFRPTRVLEKYQVNHCTRHKLYDSIRQSRAWFILYEWAEHVTCYIMCSSRRLRYLWVTWYPLRRLLPWIAVVVVAFSNPTRVDVVQWTELVD